MLEILRIIEKDGLASVDKIAEITGRDADTVKKQLSELKESGIVAGYKAVVNWDKYDSNTVIALIDVKMSPQLGSGYDRVAAKIYNYPFVKSVYLMSGGYDLSITIEGKSLKEIANFVSEKLAPMECILSTTTHFILRKYKEEGFILDNPEEDRRVVTF
ncbi:MAG: Lrp/AsnC family transcriptional regulator [Clostridia bacterium]|nr:Lrp/AsnC family transcriptional regulator [Clostridia bacterium]